MAKTKGLALSEALEKMADLPPRVQPRPEAKAEAAAARPKRAGQPSRQGTKTIAGHFAAAASKQFKLLALERDTNVQELLREALNDLFTKHGKKPIA